MEKEIKSLHLAIYVINSYQLEALIYRKTSIFNLPSDAKIYKIMPWRPEDCDNVIAIWFSHPSFQEAVPGCPVMVVHPLFNMEGAHAA